MGVPQVDVGFSLGIQQPSDQLVRFTDLIPLDVCSIVLKKNVKASSHGISVWMGDFTYCPQVLDVHTVGVADLAVESGAQEVGLAAGAPLVREEGVGDGARV